MTALKDLVGTLLIVALLPLWMVVGLVAVVVIVVRQLLWWARAHTTSVSGTGDGAFPNEVLP